MDYYGLLFLYYLKGLSGKSILRLFFNIEVGGTEQLLPENTSTPTTTPILADIQYPDGLRTDQYFTYRETPTTVSNKARIKTIKGNTLNWNQLQLIPTNSSTTSNGITFTNNNDGSVTANGTATGTAIFYCNSFPLTSGHKYLFKGCPSGGTSNTYMQSIRVNSASTIIGTDVGNGDVYTANANYTDGTILLRIMSGVTLNNAKFYPQVFDLTQMGLDSLTFEDFTSLFPLSYYSYNQGSLLSFNGNGIKTVGKNQIVGRGSGNIYNGGLLFPVKQGQTVYWGGEWTGGPMYSGIFESKNETSKNNRIAEGQTIRSGEVFAEPITKDGYFGICCNGSVASYTVTKMMASFVPFTMSEYESYTESVLSLPISTYFPNGMDGVGTDYDELTNTKATTRMTRVDLGSLTWTKESRQNRFNSRALEDAKSFPSDSVANAICAKYITITADDTYFGNDGLSIDSGGRINIYDSAYASATASDFKTAMSGVYLVYPLATPTETPITTEDANEALSLLMGKSVSSSNANQLINIITKGE